MTSTQKTGLSAEPGPGPDGDAYRAALDRTRRLCASRECCVHDIITRLRSWKMVPENQEEKIISSLQAEKFIDEARYAAAFARDKLRYNKWGRIKIAYHLKMKSIPPDIINEALQQIDEEEYVETAGKIVMALLRTKKGAGKAAITAKVISSMQSKGFEFALSLELIRKHL